MSYRFKRAIIDDVIVRNIDDDLKDKLLDLFEATMSSEQIAAALVIPKYRVKQIFDKVIRRCGLATRAQLFLALFEAGQARGR